MPLWPARPDPWPSTVEEALALPAHWHVSERFLEIHASNPDPERRALLIRSYVAFLYNSFIPARWFNIFLWECIALVVVVGLLRRLVTPRLVRALPEPLRRAHTLFTKHYSLAPLVGKKALAAVPLASSKRLSRWTTVQVPLRPDVLLLGVFLAANLLVAFTGYDVPWPNGFYSEEQGHLVPLVRHVADRTGVIALGETPLVFLLAARNSPFTWLLGVDFGTLQIYHRWVAKVTYANVTVHMIGYSLIHLQAYEWAFLSLFQKKYLVLGWVAFFGGWVLCFGAWRRIRQIAYEAFLIGHIVAALAWVVGSYLHVFFLGGKGASEDYLKLCYITAALWGFDRVARRVLLIWHNTPFGRTFASTASRPPASSRSSRRWFAADGVLLGASDDFVRLRITPASPWSYARGGPGSFVYVSCFSAGHRAWESHPFSIAWPLGVPDGADDEVDSGAASPVGSLDGSPASKSTRLDDFTPSPPPSPTLTAFRPHPFDEHASPASFELLVKRYSGFTHALVESLSLPDSAIPSSAADEPLVLSGLEDGVHRSALRIGVEGPYGAANAAHPCATYKRALLVAGGSGLAMVTSQLADLGVRVLRECGGIRCEKVVVVWSVREAETVALIIPYLHRLYRLFRAAPSFRQQYLLRLDSGLAAPEPFIDLHIYITSSSSPSSPAILELETLALPPEFLRLALHTDEGRPDVGAHIDALGGEEDDEELLVVSCGPAALCDATREAVRSRLGGGGMGRKGWEACRLVYSEEAVVW
ncbi:ferric-chelate reductase Frp1 [Rhodotorula kratochvilovae]